LFSRPNQQIRTDPFSLVVRGRPNPLQAAGRDAGIKLIQIQRLREKGHRITLLNETLFWRLAGRKLRSAGLGSSKSAIQN
jgi:hypothetical protein